jgi:hypothetical protein
MNKKRISLLVIIVVLVVVLLALKNVNLKKLVSTTPKNESAEIKGVEKETITPSGVKVQTLSPEKEPTAFPKNTPWESGAKVLSNYQTQNPTTGKTQYTRIFESAKTQTENYAIYEKYLKDEGYKILTAEDKADVKILFGVKGQETFAVDLIGKNVVKVSFVK